jgi:hypothetical protein
MSPEARELLGQKLEQLKNFQDNDQIAINARDLRAFGMDVSPEIPGGNPVFLTVGDLRAVAVVEEVQPVKEDCGCPETE